MQINAAYPQTILDVPAGVQTDSDRWQDSLRCFYDRVRTKVAGGWRRYYYQRIKQRLAGVVEPGSRVLDIGCGDGELLASLRPAYGVGVDLNRRAIERASRTHPRLRFLQMKGEDAHSLCEQFDYVIICQAMAEVYDLQAMFDSLQSVCHARTRLVVVHYNRLWQPILKLMEWLRLKDPAPEMNWLPSDEVDHLLSLARFETVRVFGMTIFPLYVPLVSAIMNRVLANLPLVHLLGLNYVIVARSVHPKVIDECHPKSVSIVVPARNEAGHIKPLLAQIPQLAEKQEIIFVEGGSTDDTWNAIREAVRDYTGPFELKCMRQSGTGKGDAVRKGFAHAEGDVLTILDADISVPPEELPRFWDALSAGHGEFINGSRMVYLMDRHAMRFLNLLGNKTFGWIFTYLLSQPFRDTLCGTKMLTREDYERIADNRGHFGDFDPFGDFDLLFGASRLNLKIVDVPVHYKARTYGETNISRFQHGWMLLRMCALAARKVRFV